MSVSPANSYAAGILVHSNDNWETYNEVYSESKGHG
jgi:hypothetical protein